MVGMDYVDVVEGSVKTIKVIEKPTPKSLGLADFHVARGVYSVFDWGAMPMEDGASLDNTPLLIETAWSMELAEDHGYLTTYRGLVMEDGRVMDLSDVVKSGEVPVAVRMALVNKLMPRFDRSSGSYDYAVYSDRGAVDNFMIPLECIHREKGPLPGGSSFDTSAGKREIDYQDYGLPESYRPGDPLPWKVLDFSTKYEETDVYHPPEKLRQMAGLSVGEFNDLQHILRAVSALYVTAAGVAGMKIDDGKIELCAVRTEPTLELAVTDFMATFHETRRSVKISDRIYVRQSKQTERNLHELRDPEWVADIKAAKKKAAERGIEDWRTLVASSPRPLPRHYFDARNEFNRAATNRLLASQLGHGIYGICKSVDEAAEKFKDVLKSLGGK
ncbi:hypothetical protein KY363_04335 [Candidatus Woesearchaeota archaeon]|nr:hypothetical protein [Candidatus Woesearchaeota archaeon]